MTALSPTPNGTAPITVPEAVTTPDRRPRQRSAGGTPPAWAQLGFTVASTSLIWFAVHVALTGFVLAAVPVTVLAAVIFAGAVLPDLLAARWDRLRAEQDAEADA